MSMQLSQSKQKTGAFMCKGSRHTRCAQLALLTWFDVSVQDLVVMALAEGA
jgi:hypothetical protein